MKFLKFLLLGLIIFVNLSAFVFAADPSDIHQTVLPGTTKNISDCEKIMRWVNINTEAWKITYDDDTTTTTESAQDIVAKRKTVNNIPGVVGDVTSLDILGCAITTGDIKMWMIPFYVRYFLEFVIGLAGLISVGALVYGGYLYLFAGLSQDKDKGKNAIKNGIIGFVLTLTAWAIVNIVMSFVTS